MLYAELQEHYIHVMYATSVILTTDITVLFNVDVNYY